MAASKGVAIVTGCASGIGRSITLRLASDGYDLALNDLPSKLPDLETLQAEISVKQRRAIIITGDVSNEEFVTEMVNNVVKELGSLEVMVANAGIAPIGSVFESQRQKGCVFVYDTNPSNSQCSRIRSYTCHQCSICLPVLSTGCSGNDCAGKRWSYHRSLF